MFLQLSHEITRLALESKTQAELFRQLAARLVELFAAQGCCIAAWDAEQGALTIAAACQRDDASGALAWDMMPDAGAALRLGQAALDQGRVLYPEPVRTDGERSLALPLCAEGQRAGAVVITFPAASQPVREEDFPHWALAAEHICLAARHVPLAEPDPRGPGAVAQPKLSPPVVLSPGLLPLLASPLNLVQVANGIFNYLEQQLFFDTALIALIEDDALHMVAGRGIPGEMLAVGKAIAPQAGFYALLKDAAQPVILADAQNHPAAQQVEAQYGISLAHLRSWMGIPLVAFTNKIGYLTLTSRQVNGFSQAHADCVATFARQAAIILENARLFEQVRHSRERLQTLSKKLVEVQEAERRHLAHELHDEIGQSLTALQFTLEMGKRQHDQALQRTLTEAQEQVSGLMNQVRELSIMLRPSILDDLGLLPALCWLFDRYQAQTGIQVHFTHQAIDRRFQPTIETTTFRVVQEALTNIARYAGVREAEVSAILDNSSTLSIQIRDQGQGFDPAIMEDHARSFGITGMYERTNLAGGIFEIITRPGQGTCITAILPVDHQVERRRNDRESSLSG